MLIDVVRPESWNELNDSLKTQLGLPTPLSARAYKGIAQAVFEITQGNAQFMSHKKSIGVIKGQTSVFESLLPYYYKETYEVSIVSHLDLKNVKEWVESLKKDTNFVLFAEDHPVTGEVYSFADELDKALNDKRIFSVRVSHARHFNEALEVRPYSVRLCSFAPEIAVAILGERFRCPPMMAQNMAWNIEEFLQDVQLSLSEHSANPKLVKEFEKSIASIAEGYFKEDQARLYDRAVIEFKDVSAEALAQKVFSKLGMSPEEGWMNISSTNMCHWSGTKMFGHWWDPTPSPETLRGMLVVRGAMLEEAEFTKILIAAHTEIMQEQSWSLE
ncbi:MAG: hypothetical protein ACM3MG_13930 [Bacillota bacterium]